MILLLPLDSRPCCYDFAYELCGVAREEVVRPPLYMMGGLDTPADYPAIRAFVEENIARCDTLIVALDMLAFGGLVQSRLGDVPLEECLARMAWLETLKAMHPHVSIYIASVVLRITISATDAESLRYYSLLHQYCTHLGRFRLTGAPEEKRLSDDLRTQLPDHLVEEFFAVRERNHAVNRRALELLENGTARRVILLQEDCEPGGIQEAEQKELQAYIDAHDLAARTSISNGADEGVLALLGAHLCQGQDYKLCILDENGHTAQYVAAFEDRPFAQNVNDFIALCGFTPVDAPEDADVTLCIHSDEGNLSLIPRIAGLLDAGRSVAVLDVAIVNGSHVPFFDALLEGCDALALMAYSGWNTASNSLGTILCNIAAALRGGQHTKENLEFLCKRYLDDYVYQSKVRPTLNAVMQDTGVNIFHFHDDAPEARALLQALFTPQVRWLKARLHCGFEAEIRFPWDRSFEAAVEAKHVRRIEK